MFVSTTEQISSFPSFDTFKFVQLTEHTEVIFANNQKGFLVPGLCESRLNWPVCHPTRHMGKHLWFLCHLVVGCATKMEICWTYFNKHGRI